MGLFYTFFMNAPYPIVIESTTPDQSWLEMFSAFRLSTFFILLGEGGRVGEAVVQKFEHDCATGQSCETITLFQAVRQKQK